VLVLGVRGTLEHIDADESGMGPALAALTDRIADGLASSVPPIPLERRGVAYPATALRYRRSLDEGARMLGEELAVSSACGPEARVVVIGLSQGAEVVRRALGRCVVPPDTVAAIAAVVLLGDPTRHPAEPFQHGSGDRRPGVRARHRVALPAALAGRTWAWCLDGDRIAAHRAGLLGVFFSGTHTAYGSNRDQVLDQAARFVLARLTPRAPAP
jgi:hypothetical protein